MKQVYKQLFTLVSGFSIPIRSGSKESPHLTISFYKPFNSFSEVYSLPIGLRKFFLEQANNYMEELHKALEKKD